MNFLFFKCIWRSTNSFSWSRNLSLVGSVFTSACFLECAEFVYDVIFFIFLRKSQSYFCFAGAIFLWHSCMSAYLYIVETPKTMRKQFIVRSVCSLDSIPFTISIFQTSYVESRSLCHSISLSSLYLLPLISWKYSFPLSFLVYLFFDKSGADHEDILCYNISKQE